MNFFSAQQQARNRTKWLVLWFALGMVGTLACLYAVATVLSQWDLFIQSKKLDWVGNPVAHLAVLGAAVIIPIGSAYKFIELSQGGSVVARDLGARKVSMATQEFSERQLLNVVEEMAIASGIPVPQVWVMDHEPSINAFAAGTEPSNAVVGVSRGCLEQLTRAELQGVVAHEFSHILNGDMRLNMRLIGWLFGLMMIALLGRGLLSIFRHTGGRSSSDNKSSGGIVLLLVLAGASLWLIGSIGVFFARIIQAAVSREREFLADASAVQFTRDPSGIAGALIKIARKPKQYVFAPKVTEAAHLLFHGPVSYFFPGLLATHPPLVKRILAIEPRWDGDLRNSAEGQKNVREEPSHVPNQSAVAAFSSVGESSHINLAAASAMLHSMQEQGSIASVAEAKGLMYALIGAGEGMGSVNQDAGLNREERLAYRHWHGKCLQMSSAQKIAWMDLAMPGLRQMSLREYQQFRVTLRQWMERDQQISLFEWMLHHAIDRHLQVCFEYRDVASIRWYHMAQVADALAPVLSCLCSLSSDEEMWNRCTEEYHRRNGSQLPHSTADFAVLDKAFGMLDAASPDLKREILELALWVIHSDGQTSDAEMELLRAMADAMGAVLPP